MISVVELRSLQSAVGSIAINDEHKTCPTLFAEWMLKE